uniref:Type I restriction enzyme, S subunit n=1 Tax=Candidatus Kentrum sp. FW TaxID=2126338 RepID=A0A450RYG8_9GAMM|nr:MAG: type I restriction enzyme, S subunit [Candidatus Kentron sp. FW]VFJ58221.1 MAG: type I restriction enzyme, S subunit [Candidatus Kentron sp. FW]
MPLDLRPDHLAIVREILHRHAPDREVWALGSRVRGTARAASDLDLCIGGNQSMGFERLGRLRDAFSASALPFRVDVVEWAGTGEFFRKVVKRDGVVVKSAEDWTMLTLGDVIDIKHGYAFKGEFFTENPTGNLLLTPGNFAIGGGFQWGKKKYYRGDIPEEYVLSPGDLLVTMTDLSKEADTLGYGAIIPQSKDRLLHNQRLGKVVVKAENVDSCFLHWLFRSPGYRDQVLAGAAGSTVKHTSPRKILSCRFMFPSLSQQSDIADVLSTLDDKIELNRRMNGTLEAMARALFKDWFVDFGPTRAKAEGRPAYLDPEIWDLFPDGLDGEGKPEGWASKPLDEIAEFLNGLALQKFPAPVPDDSLPVIKIAELRGGITAKTNRASREIPEKYVVKDGDFLFSWSGSLLAKFWTEGEGALNQHLFKVTSARYPAWFFSQWVFHFLHEFQAIAASKATTMGHIQRGHLKEAMTVGPSDEVLATLGHTIAPLVERGIQNELEAQTLAQLRDLLLPKLMTGEIRVREAEKIAEKAI